MYIRKLRVVEGFVFAKPVGLPAWSETAMCPNIVWCSTRPDDARAKSGCPASTEPSSQPFALSGFLGARAGLAIARDVLYTLGGVGASP
jgi:hypothetical protein